MKAKYIVQYHRTKTDKRGEKGQIKVIFKNGEKFVTSEKYENVTFAKKEAREFALRLNADFQHFENGKLVETVSRIEG